MPAWIVEVHTDERPPKNVDELRPALFKFAQAESLCHLADGTPTPTEFT